MTTPPITAAAVQALAAYGTTVARSPSPAPTAPEQPQPPPAPVRHVVRSAPGFSVELSADARAALIAVQSGASTTTAAGPGSEPPPRPAQTQAPLERPGGRLNLTI